VRIIHRRRHSMRHSKPFHDRLFNAETAPPDPRLPMAL
jgi:hypothetical protein